MGWNFAPGASKADILRELKAPFELSDGGRVECLSSSLKGNVLWTVREVTSPDGTKSRYIGCEVIERHGDGWRYKLMEEAWGPGYFSCPLSFLDMVPPPDDSPYSAEWREEVRRYHAARAREPRP